MLAELQRDYAAKRFDAVVQRARSAAALAQDANALIVAANAAIQIQALADADLWLTQLRSLHRDDAALRRIHANVLNRLGVQAGDKGHLDEARARLQQAHTLDPANATVQFNLAIEWRRAGRDAEAVPLLIALQNHNPRDEAVNLNLAECHAYAGNQIAVGELMDAQRDHGFSEQARWRRVALDTAIDAHWDLLLAGAANTQRGADVTTAVVCEQVEQGRRDAALATAATGFDVYEGAPSIWRSHLAAMLHPGSIMASSEAIDEERQRWREALDALRDIDLTTIPPALSQLSWSNFAFGYHGRDELATQSDYGDWLCEAAPRMRSDLRMDLSLPRRDRARVVLASSHWRHCTAGHYFHAWIGALAQCPELEVIVLAVSPDFDDLTDGIANIGVRVQRVEGDVNSDLIAEALLALAPDLILYPELGMDVRLLPVAALRLAPVQVMAWGHPVTSGLPSIDAYLSCAEMEPANAQSHYREPLHLLPGIGTRYLAPARPVIGTRAELGLHEGPLVVVPQSGVKIHPDNDAIYRDLLAQAPTAKLMFFRNESATVTRQLQNRLALTLPATSLARVDFHPLCAREHFLRVIGSCNLMLDTLHWSGGNTALDALRMGTPILTAPGTFMRGRQSAAMLRILDLEHALVTTPDQLATRAATLLTGNELPELRTLIDQRFDRLLDGDDALEKLRATIRDLLDGHRRVLS